MTKRRKRTRRRTYRRKRWSFSRVRNIALTILFAILLWRLVSPSTFNSVLSWIGLTSDTVTMNYDGIDVSKHNGKIDWDKVSNDRQIKFVYIKASEGRSLGDHRYTRNVKEARRVALKVGSYHYFISRCSAKEQFENFRKRVKKGDQDLLPMIDVEEKGNKGCNRTTLQAGLKEMMELMKSEYGKYPIIYSNHDFFNTYLAPEFNNYYLFLARYGGKEPKVKGGGHWNIWQFSETGHVDGIRGKVDLECFASGTSTKDIRY